jgi:protein-tyrosine phosphatase
MAAALFNYKMMENGWNDHFRAESAGTWAVDGLPAPEDGQKAMRVRGLDTSSHRSRIVDRKIIRSADLVLTMEAGQKEALRVEFPEQSKKIWMLSELAGPPYDIPDPYLQGSARYEEIVRELDHLLDLAVDWIFSFLDETE